jgi:hypothetical protein
MWLLLVRELWALCHQQCDMCHPVDIGPHCRLSLSHCQASEEGDTHHPAHHLLLGYMYAHQSTRLLCPNPLPYWSCLHVRNPIPVLRDRVGGTGVPLFET